jgi:hypothetical protein
MIRRTLVRLLTLVAVAVPFGPAGAVEPYTPIPTLPEAARTRLLRFVASDDTDAFLADSLLGLRLEHVLGAELAHLRQNIDVRGSVAYSSGMVYVTGNAPHHGGEEHGFVGIETYSGRICAAVYSRGRFDVYGAGTNRDGVPVALREWILATWAYVSLDGSIPSAATLVGEAPNR